MALLALALISATPTNFAAVIQAAKPGDTIVLKGTAFRNLSISRKFAKPVTIEAEGAIVRGVSISGDGIVWKSGVIRSVAGNHGIGPSGYGALVTGNRITFSGVRFTSAKKGMVIDRASAISIEGNEFTGLGEDGIVLARSRNVVIRGNTFGNTVAKKTTCTLPSQILTGLSKSDCQSRGGTWKDGFHPDAIQMRNAVLDVSIRDNVVRQSTQGITQMDTVGDAPLERVTIQRNLVFASIHHITLGECIGCVIKDNQVRRWKPGWAKAIIRKGKARRCENDVEDESFDGPC